MYNPNNYIKWNIGKFIKLSNRTYGSVKTGHTIIKGKIVSGKITLRRLKFGDQLGVY